ncbi:UPF0606 protein KIAA1549 [Chanos chanos]|uniref:UPF0606 protein KIAA1549 n=1 Tax=Chanos chanos TaxID=29144 RepID=A0A6J2WQ28_CHACN|nr:UPF0606 protein KIAA1549 homolog [Chanos chanos]
MPVAPENYNNSAISTVFGSVFSGSGSSFPARPEPLSSPAPDPSESGVGVGLRPGASRVSRDLNPPVPGSSPVPMSPGAITPNPRHIQSSPNLSAPPWNISPSLSVSDDLDTDVRGLDEPPLPSPGHQSGPTIVMPLSLEPPSTNDSVVAHGKQLVSSSRVGDLDHLHPSSDPNIQNDAALGIQLLDPSQAVFGNLHMTSTSVEPTIGLLEDFFPTNTMEVDWGSGDYLETMSFMGSEGDDYSLVTNLPSDMYEFEDSNSEAYDTAFPTRVVVSLSSRHPSPSPLSFPTGVSSMPTTSSPNLTTAAPNTVFRPPSISSTSSILSTTTYLDLPAIHPTSAHSSHIPPTLTPDLNHSSVASESSELDSDWADSVTIEPTDVLLPDMNSLEYMTIQLGKDNTSIPEHRGDQTSSRHLSLTPISTSQILPTRSYAVDPSHMLTVLYEEELQPADNTSWAEDSSADTSGFEPVNDTVLDTSELRPTLMNTTESFLESSVALTPSMVLSNSMWDQVSSTDRINTASVSLSVANSTSTMMSVFPTMTQEQDFGMSSVVTDIQQFTSTPSLSSSVSVTAFPTEPAPNVTSFPDVSEMADQDVNTITPSEAPTTASTDDDGLTTDSSTETTFTTLLRNETGATTFINIQTTTTTATSNEAFNLTTLPTAVTDPFYTTLKTTPQTTTSRDYLCNMTKTDTYLVRVGFPSGSTAGYAKAKVREVLKAEFNRTVELQVVKAPPDFVFRTVSGPVVYTAIAVINALRQSTRTARSILSVSPISTAPGQQYQVHSVLQFVPSHVDVRVCTFLEQIEKGLTAAFAEVRRRSQESTNFTVHITNITMSAASKTQRLQKSPIDITFAVRDAHGYVLGSEVSSHLRMLNMVEFSYYLGYPVLQIAEPFHYPELNMTQLLRSSWVRTVLLGVLDTRVSDRIFQAKMERRLAMLLGEALGTARRIKRATTVGNNSVQIVRTTRLVSTENPLEMIYFVEGPNGERLPAVTTANLLNSLDVQRAAIILGHRVQGILAQPVEKVGTSPSESENTNTWIIIGVVVPVVVAVIIISILYWKLCRTDKLEFQPDTMTTVQQRQKLQAPSVKGFDFAKLHLGQHSKDDLMVIQEPAPLPVPPKELSPSDNGEVPTPKSKGSSTKTSRNGRRKGRISPSDGGSVASDPSSERDSPEENLRQAGLSSDTKQPRKMAINGLNGPLPLNGVDEQLSSAAIFEHVDRMSRPADGPKRFSSKIQLIAMQPMPALPLPSPTANHRMAENAKLNKEIQVALRHKSEIEHHRNKIRLRAKRKGHYDFPAMDDLVNGLGDTKEQDHIYQKAQMQIDKILDPDVNMSSLYSELKKSGRGKRSPKQRKRQHMNGAVTDADRDRLISAESDGTYKKYPGVNNIAYVSDPDQGPDPRSPSPTDDVFLGPGSPPPGHPPPPPPYLPPQPSIEEARQQMHSLLDDAFALVSPTSHSNTAGITLPGVSAGPLGSSPPSRGPRPWGQYLAHSPLSARYTDIGLTPPSVQNVLHRQGVGSGYIPAGDAVAGGEQLHSDGLYAGRTAYNDELPSSARPRPVGGAAGNQFHHLTQLGLTGRASGHQSDGRQPSGYNWSPYNEEEYSRPVLSRDTVTCRFVFQTPRTGLKEPSAPPAHLDSIGLGYPLSAPPEETSPPNHSSASLIKAIREELMRLSQKQASVSGYHS